MRTNILRSVALALGLSCTIASAQTNFDGYSSPAKWNKFNTRTRGTFVATQIDGQEAIDAAAQAAELPAPVPPQLEALPEPTPDATLEPMPELMPEAMPQTAMDTPIGSGSAYSEAACAPLASACRPPLSRCFGGASLLFLTKENSGHRNLIVDDATGTSVLNTSAVNPNGSTGFEVFAGRYLHCNQYGLSVGYMLWNPSQESNLLIPPGVGDYRPAVPAWNNISVDPGTGVASVYSLFDGAAAYRVRRDMQFQGVEVALSCFGMMGARRAAACNPACGGGSILGNRLRGLGLGRNRNCRGYGRLGGPIIPGCGGRVQITTSHGLRWFQAKDEFQLAANIDGTVGYQANDVYYDIDTENNLYGYQFGGRLSYCLTCRTNLYVGGKFGLYGNNVQYRQRIGTETAVAYRTGTATDVISTSDSDTVFSTLGELDLGLGFRLTNALTFRGGYRLFGLTGVASATDQFANDFSTVAASRYVSANDSFVLHGGYVGLDYNW